MVITIAQCHSLKPELRFCAGSNPAGGISETWDGENLWQWYRLEIRLNAPCHSTIPQKNNSIHQPPGVSLKTLSPRTVFSWLYLLIFKSFVKSCLCWLWHISLFLRDSNQTFLTFYRTKWKFLYNPSLCVLHFFAQTFIVSIPAAVILEFLSFPFI